MAQARGKWSVPPVTTENSAVFARSRVARSLLLGLGMRVMKSGCGRFVVLEGVHLDRRVFDSFACWAEGRQLRVQDAIQLAMCAVTMDGSGVCRTLATPEPQDTVAGAAD